MKEQDKETLKTNEGMRTIPSSLNPHLRHRKRPKSLSLEQYVEGIKKGDHIILSKAITLVESKHPKYQEQAQQIIEACLPFSGRSVRIGITGSPGVGKSTFIESLGFSLINEGRQLAILAIDPSSQLTKGSILGDKTRMEHLSKSEKTFIRPSPSGYTLGGVARKTRETILLCEAAGFDTIIIETVGVGQSEIAVHSMVDFFLLLLLPGGGDELQGIKRGIVEMADLIAVNKADGDRLTLAKKAKRAYKNAIHLLPPKASGWNPPVVLCSGQEHIGIIEIWQKIQDYIQLSTENNFFQKRRKEQASYWLHETIEQQLKQQFYNHPDIKDKLPEIKEAILKGRLSSFQGAELLLKLFGK